MEREGSGRQSLTPGNGRPETPSGEGRERSLRQDPFHISNLVSTQSYELQQGAADVMGVQESVKVKVAQSCPTLCDPIQSMEFSMLEWGAIPFTRVIFQTQGSNHGLLHCRWILYQLSHQGSPRILE